MSYIILGWLILAPSALIAQSEAIQLVEKVRIRSDLLYRIADAHVHDGQVWIGNEGTLQVLVFDMNDGRLVRQIGGEGRGPGEFEAIHDVAVDDDRLYVTDLSLGRVSEFQLDGTLEETWRIPGEWIGAEWAGRIGHDDHVFLRQTGATIEGYTRYRADLTHFSKEETDAIVSLPGRDLFWQAVGGRVYKRAVPFGRDAFASASGEYVVVGSSAEEWVWLWQRGSEEATRVTVPWPKELVRQEDREEELDKLVDRLDQRGLFSSAGAFEEMPDYDAFPSFSSLTVDDKGRIWFGFSGTDEDYRLRVVAQDGRILDVTMPQPADLLHVNDGSVVGMMTDELGVESIVIFSFIS